MNTRSTSGQNADFSRLSSALKSVIDRQNGKTFDLPSECQSILDWDTYESYSLTNFNACAAFSNATRDSQFDDYAQATTIVQTVFEDVKPRGGVPNDAREQQGPIEYTRTLTLSDFGIINSDDEKKIAQEFPQKAVRLLSTLCNTIQCDDVIDATAVQQLKESHGPDPDLSNLFVPFCDPSHMLISDKVLSWDGVQDCSGRLCAAVSKQIIDDPDIGGIGVCISYVIEILFVIAMAAYIIGTSNRRHSRTYAAEYRERHGSSSSRNYRKFVRACTRFQKAQCWFIGALAIAAFTRQPSSSIGVLDQYLLTNVTLNGIVLISFTLIILFYLEATLGSNIRSIKNDGSGRISWFVFFQSLGAFVLCGGFMLYELVYFNTTTLDWLNASSGLCYMGLIEQRFDPVLRFVNNSADIPPAAYAVCLGVTSFVMVLLTIRQIFPNCRIWTATVGWFLTSPASKAFLATTILLLYCILMALQLHLLALFFQYIDPTNFGFGQVVATLVWAPCIIDYLQDIYEGKKQPLFSKKPTNGNTFYIKDNASTGSTTTTLNRPPTTSNINAMGSSKEDDEPELARAACGVVRQSKKVGLVLVNVKEAPAQEMDVEKALEKSLAISGPPRCVIS